MPTSRQLLFALGLSGFLVLTGGGCADEEFGGALDAGESTTTPGGEGTEGPPIPPSNALTCATGTAGDEGCDCTAESGCNSAELTCNPVIKKCIPECAEGMAYSQFRKKCVSCSPCDLFLDQGETGRAWPITAGSGCLCETTSGYFHSEAGFPQPIACDADNDGWVTETARTYLEEEPGSPLRENARCDLRTIDRVVIVQENGLSREIVLEAPVPLFEHENLDDQSLLDEDITSLPPYGSGGRRVLAGEVNSLTKACVSSLADFNKNDVADINEWDQVEGVALQQQPLARFAYFLELYRGWYAKAEGDRYGKYFIKEKSRAVDNGPLGKRIPVEYFDSGVNANWRQCVLAPDKSYTQENPTIGMDFVRHSPALSDLPLSFADIQAIPAAQWQGLNHESLYKCLEIVPENDPAIDPVLAPHKKSPSALNDADGAKRYYFNTCTAVPPPASKSWPPVESQANPADPDITCAGKSAPLTGDIGWAVFRYRHYERDEDFQRGCINQCYESDGYCGVCKTGSWECDGDKYCGPPRGASTNPDGSVRKETTWQCGENGVPKACYGISLPAGVGRESLNCDDTSPQSSFIYVSTLGSDQEVAGQVRGSRRAPFRTIQRGLDAAQARGAKIVLVSEGVFDEKVTLRNGISIYGGYSNDEDGDGVPDWRRRSWLRTIIQNSRSENCKIVTVDASDIASNATTVLAQLVIKATGVAPGTPYGIYDSRNSGNPSVYPAGVEVRGNVSVEVSNPWLLVTADGNDANDGTCERPMATLAGAINKAKGTSGASRKTHIGVSTDNYTITSPLNLSSGINIIGGWDAGARWVSAASSARTTIINNTAANGKIIGISGTDITAVTRVENLTISLGNNTSAGGSNYGIYLKNSNNQLTLKNLTINTGNGGNGTNGSSGANASGPIETDARGNGGRCQFSGAAQLGADGGNGGFGDCNSGGRGGDGGNGFNSGGSNCTCSRIDAGGGHTNYSLFFAMPGQAGGAGVPGYGGGGGTNFGQINDGYYVVAGGQNGTNGGGGKSGAGGGGGCSCSRAGPNTIPFGGRGGDGGCGGQGGFAGTGGGGVFGIFLNNSAPTFEGYLLINGGRGGNGGAGGNGGSGSSGKGGSQGASISCVANYQSEAGGGGPGAAGGGGGAGGSGGGGGGGGGGPSYCVYATGSLKPALPAAFSCAGTQGGGGGAAGGPAGAGAGAAGVTGAKNW